MLLAGMGLSKNELQRLLSTLQSVPTPEIVQAVSALSEFRAWLNEPELPPIRHTGQRSPRDSSVGERVERLLKEEANLSGQAAYHLLRRMLLEYSVMPERHIPPLSKKALRVWINKLIGSGVPEKEILRLATIARNEVVHSPQTDWQLGNRNR